MAGQLKLATLARGITYAVRAVGLHRTSPELAGWLPLGAAKAFLELTRIRHRALIKRVRKSSAAEDQLKTYKYASPIWCVRISVNVVNGCFFPCLAAPPI